MRGGSLERDFVKDFWLHEAMAYTPGSPRLAVLIDGENISSDHIDAVLKTAEKWGSPVLRRLYGNANSPKMKSWVTAAKTQDIDIDPPAGYTAGKNSSDIALCIDAMDVLLSRRLDAFCIVSSDSDFTHLVRRIREHGLPCYGIGTTETKAGQSVYDGFMALTAPKPVQATVPVQKPVPKPKPKPKPKAAQAIPAAIAKAITETKTKSGWSKLKSVTGKLKQGGGFKFSEHGAKSLEELLVKHPGQVELERDATKKITRVRMNMPEPSKAA